MKTQLLKASDVDAFGDARRDLVSLERHIAGLRGIILASGRTEYTGERYRVTVVKKDVERLDAATIRSAINYSPILRRIFGRLLKVDAQVEVRTTVLKGD